MRNLALALSLFWSLTSLHAGDDFLLSFPNIHTSSEIAVFANDRWAAVYTAEMGVMYTMPLDSFTLPPVSVSGRETTVDLKGVIYSRDPLRLNALHVMRGFSDSVVVLPQPSERSMAPLNAAWKREATSGEVTEEISPLRGYAGKLWFGIIAKTPTDEGVGGLGWYEPETMRFGKVYSPELSGFIPRWIDGRSDTIFVFYEHADMSRGGKLISFSIATGQLAELDLRGYGIPGDTLLNVSDWFATFLIATDKCVAIWANGNDPWVWQTTACAARDSVWLQFATFDTKSKRIIPSGDFLPMKLNMPAQVYAQFGNWVLLLAQSGVEATLPASEWDKRSESLTTSDWGCGNKSCFARVTIRAKGADRAMDLLNTPLMLLSEEDDKVKVGMQAGWAEVDRLVPVLTKK